MTPAEIMNGLQAKNRMLSQKNEEYLKLAEKRAQAEKDYNIIVAQQTLEFKVDKQPATIIPTLVKGAILVAEAKFKFDVSQAVEKACLESIKDLRSAIDTYRSLLAWLKAEMTNQ